MIRPRLLAAISDKTKGIGEFRYFTTTTRACWTRCWKMTPCAKGSFLSGQSGEQAYMFSWKIARSTGTIGSWNLTSKAHKRRKDVFDEHEFLLTT